MVGLVAQPDVWLIKPLITGCIIPSMVSRQIIGPPKSPLHAPTPEQKTFVSDEKVGSNRGQISSPKTVTTFSVSLLWLPDPVNPQPAMTQLTG